ncbi:MAG: SpoIIIAC/SpoIIIAD family protein [Clostridia bacterium]
MDIFKIIGVGLVTLVASLLVRQIRPEISPLIALGGGVIIILMVLNYVQQLYSAFNLVVDKSGINKSLIISILKIVGIGYLTEFSAGVCTDSGMQTLGDKIALAGKVIILCYSLPIITSIIEIVVELLP